ncbi:MAG: PQQ-like beta-propeller repeat protein, partial [Planctomycetaceae bacterium]|nr:PQQ-like beta-propeller repeat protein [Planctomycetaceae bacterium]
MNRKITVLCLMTVVTALSVVQSASAQNNLLNETPLPSSRILNRFGLERTWWGQATLNSARDKIMHVALDERIVVMIASSGIVTAFDAESGHKLWVIRIGRNDQTTLMPVMNEKQVFIVSGLKLYALDRLSGGIIWELNLPQFPSTAPSADENQIYIGTLDGSVYAFDIRKIKELYQERLLPEYSLSAQRWRYKTGAKITSPPVTTGRVVSFASRDHSLYAVSAKTRRLLYQFETDSPISAPIIKHGKHIYLASEDFNFYCLNAENGQVQWSFLSGVPIRRSPYVIGNQVLVLPEAGGISALRIENGREIWPKPQMR